MLLQKKLKKVLTAIRIFDIIIKRLGARELRSLKTEQETSIQKILGNNERKVRS